MALDPLRECNVGAHVAGVLLVGLPVHWPLVGIHVGYVLTLSFVLVLDHLSVFAPTNSSFEALPADVLGKVRLMLVTSINIHRLGHIIHYIASFCRLIITTTTTTKTTALDGSLEAPFAKCLDLSRRGRQRELDRLVRWTRSYHAQ